MLQEELIIQELGSSKILVYKGDVENLNFHLNLPNILTFVRTTFVEVPLCYFDVSGKIPLSEIQRYTLDKYDILKMIKMTIAISDACETDNISLDNILFNNDYVFVDDEFNTYFIPLKIENENNVDIHTFLKNIVINSIIDARYTDNFVQLLLNCFNEPKFSIAKLSSLVNQLIATKPYALPYEEKSEDKKDEKHYSEPKETEPENYTDTIIVDMLKRQLDNKTNKPVQHNEKEETDESAPEGQKEILESLTLKTSIPDGEDDEEFDDEPIYAGSVNSGFMPNMGGEPSYMNGQNSPVSVRQLNDLPEADFKPDENYSDERYDDIGTNDYYEMQSMENHPLYDDMMPDKYEGDYDEVYSTEATTMNSNGYETRAFLVNTNDPITKVPITLNPFRIGRNPDLVDYVINSPYVGRLHAIIQSDDENNYYIVDKSSTNGTFLNDKRLHPEEAVHLVSGAVVRFAKHSFEFVIE